MSGSSGLIKSMVVIQCLTVQRSDMGVTGNRRCIYILLGEVENRVKLLDVTSDCIDDMNMTMAGSGCTTMSFGVMNEQEAHQSHLGSVGCRGAGLDLNAAQGWTMGISGCSAALMPC